MQRIAWLITLTCAAFALLCGTLAYAGPDRVLALVQRLPVAWVDRDEPKHERLARMKVVADAFRPFSMRERAAGLSVWYGESKLAKHVRDDCSWRPEGSAGNCDHGKAKGYGQHHRASCPKLWTLPSGSDEAVHESARCTVRLLRFGHARCGSVAGAMAVFGGLPCDATTPNIQSKLGWYRRLGGQ